MVHDFAWGCAEILKIKYDRIEKTPWESCTKVLDNGSRKEALLKGW
jgi:hypothetical protein